MSIAAGLWLAHCACAVGDDGAAHVGSDVVLAHAAAILPGEFGTYGIAVRRLNTSAHVPADGDFEECRPVEFIFANGFDRNPEFLSRLAFEYPAGECKPEEYPSLAADVGGFYTEVATADLDRVTDSSGARTDEVVWGSLANTGAALGSGGVGFASISHDSAWALRDLSEGANASVAAVAVADLNNDGLLDVIAGTWRFETERPATHVSCRVADSSGGGGPPKQNLGAASARDINTRHIAGAPVVVYLQKRTLDEHARLAPEFEPPVVIDDLDGVTHIVVTDLNRDGRPELVTSGVGPHYVNVVTTTVDHPGHPFECVELPIPNTQASRIEAALAELAATNKDWPVSALTQDVDATSAIVPSASGDPTIVTTVAASLGCLSLTECMALRSEGAVDVWTLTVPQGGPIVGSAVAPARVHRFGDRIPQALRLVDVVGNDGRPDLLVSSMFAPCFDLRRQVAVPGFKSMCVGGPLLVSIGGGATPLGQEWRPIAFDALRDDGNPAHSIELKDTLYAPAAYRMVPYRAPKFGRVVTTEECGESGSPLDRRSLAYYGPGTVIDVQSVSELSNGEPGKNLGFSMLPDTRVVVLDELPRTTCARVEWIVTDHPLMLLAGVGTGVEGMESPSLLMSFESK